MVRTYKKKGLVTPIDYDKLVKLVKNENKSVRSAGASCGINYRTLCRNIGRVDEKFPNFAEVTDDELLLFLKAKSSLDTKPVNEIS